MFRQATGAALAMLAAGCCPPSPLGARIDGPYVLSAAVLSPQGGAMICYARVAGSCRLRIPPSVALYGWDEDYITAAVRPIGYPGALQYYYIVRLFDGPEADSAAAVRGPFSKAEFEKVRWRHCVPVDNGSNKRKCFPWPVKEA